MKSAKAPAKKASTKSTKQAPGNKEASATAKKLAAKAETKKQEQPSGKPTFLDVMNKVNADFMKAGAKGPVLVTASHANCSYTLRRPTGVLSLDIALGGGFPASAPSVIVGPEGVGKDYLLWKTAGEVQRLYGDEFAMAVYFTEFMPDKGQMRMAGLQVGYSDTEIEDLRALRASQGRPELTAEEVKELKAQTGNIALIAGVPAEEGFDILADILASGTCQIIAVNSIGFLQTAAKEATDSFADFAQQRNEAMLLTKVAPKFAMLLNNISVRNETSVLLINQVRAKDGAVNVRGRAATDRDRYKAAAQSMALRHGLAIEVSLYRGSPIYYEATKEYLGRDVKWELTKGKLGTHDGLRGEYTYLYADGIDSASDVLATAERLGLIKRSGSWFEYPSLGIKTQGSEGFRFKLRNDPELMERIRGECLNASKINYRYR